MVVDRVAAVRAPVRSTFQICAFASQTVLSESTSLPTPEPC